MQQASEMKIVGSLALLYVFRMLGLFMVFPIMMIYGDEYVGSTTVLLGMALGLYGVTQAVFQIPMGVLSDVWGRKQVILLGLVLFGLGSVIAAASESIWGLLIGRLLQGTGAIAAAILALVGDLTSEKNRTKAMAVIGASIGLSFAIALFLGPLLATFGGISTVFWASSLFAVVGMAILFGAIPSAPQKSQSSNIAVPALLRSTLANRDLLRLNWAIFCLHFVLTATFVLAPLLLEKTGLPGKDHWHYYLPIMLIAFIGMLPFMFLAERKQKMKLVMLLAILSLIASECILHFYGGYRSGWIVALLWFFVAFNLLEATLPSLLSKQAPVGSKGTAMGVYSTCQFLGAALGGIVGGLMFDGFGSVGVVTSCVVLCSIWFVSAFWLRFPQRANGQPVSSSE